MKETRESKDTCYVSKGKVTRLLGGSMASKEIWRIEISTDDFKEFAVEFWYILFPTQNCQ